MAFIELKQIHKLFPDQTSPAVQAFNLNVEQGEIVTLLGPSGCGKTTTLRMIAGFERPDKGSIMIGGKVVCDEQSSLAPEKRSIGMVFQDYALFPHLTIEKNVTFGLGKWSSAEKKSRAIEVLELVGLADLADRYPHQLSGGQQQRVALARALAPRPHVILMDEPFSNLDAGLRERMRSDVTDILRKAEMTAIIVTHDQKDAFAVSDRVAVMNGGLIQQIATPKEMYRSPRNSFVAQFLGKTNLLSGPLDQDKKHIWTGIGKVCLREKSANENQEVTVSIRPEACRLMDTGRYHGTVEKVTYNGEYQELKVNLKCHENQLSPCQYMVIYAPIESNFEIGRPVQFDITPELVTVIEQ